MQVANDEGRRQLTALLIRTGNGDRAAFQDLYGRTSAKLFGIALRILRDEALARDVLQEAYVKIWSKASEFDAAVASPMTWMATIVRNRSIDEVRRVKPATLSIGSSEDEIDVADDLGHPLDGRERSEDLRRLLYCLNSLEEEHRQIVLLAYYRGLSREELAGRFDRPVSTVKTWLRRSLGQLKGCLQHDGGR